jgi:hypothetical protein
MSEDIAALMETIRNALGTCEYALLVSGNDNDAHEAIRDARLALDAVEHLADSNGCIRP